MVSVVLKWFILFLLVLDIPQMERFRTSLFSRMYIQGLIHGNINKEVHHIFLLDCKKNNSTDSDMCLSPFFYQMLEMYRNFGHSRSPIQVCYSIVAPAVVTTSRSEIRERLALHFYLVKCVPALST